MNLKTKFDVGGGECFSKVNKHGCVARGWRCEDFVATERVEILVQKPKNSTGYYMGAV